MPAVDLHPILFDGSVPDFPGSLDGFGQEMAARTAQFYQRVGFRPPFIGYLAADAELIVGSCGFKGPPKKGRVEIAYVTDTPYRGRGVATAMARSLLRIAEEFDANQDLVIVAETLPSNAASGRILSKLGFGVTGEAKDPDHGPVHLWTRGAAPEKLHPDPPPLVGTRIEMRALCAADAPFMLRLMNEAGWLRFIGDRAIRDLAAARDYLLSGPIESYRQHGFGLMLVRERKTQEALGICGLLQRARLDAPDLGFAFLDDVAGRGFATEAGALILGDAAPTRLLGVTLESNVAARRVLEKLGFVEGDRSPEGKENLLLFERPPENPS
jgi:RimJ/RimL family protein N-acetyltransferase